MAKVVQPAGFFVVGGTLERAAASYARRPADEDLLHRILAGEYCNVLAARQTGKSSLMVRTAERLEQQGVKPVIIDLTAIGSQVTAEQWYIGLISYLTRQLKLHVDEHTWWNARKEKSPVQRFSEFLYEVVLAEIDKPVVIFIDEIDSTLKLTFTDDFFAAIRAAYNARSQDPDLKRLTFVLLGVARPADLIKDRTRTPYNIGIGIDITDFRIEELENFESILEKAFSGQGRQILEWILAWTGGQPYLTQKLSSEVVKLNHGPMSEEELAELVERLFLGDMARTETNLRSIRDQVKKNPYAAKMLRIYSRVLANKQVIVEEQSIEQNELKLTGLVKATPQGTLHVRNRIYANIFDKAWIKENTPGNPAVVAAIISVTGAIIVTAVTLYSNFQLRNQTADIQAQTHIDNFNTSNSQEVRISGLAGLFGLGEEYPTQARGLFFALDPEQQLALFNLTTPENVGEELVVVVEGTYQYVGNTSKGNSLLGEMAHILQQTSAPGATGLTLEINTWLDAREAASRQDYPLATSLYTRALEYSKDRNQENSSILMERASVYTTLEQYAEALADYDAAVGLDAVNVPQVQNSIFENQNLTNYWRENSARYPNLSRSLVKPTELPTSMPTPTATAEPALASEITDSHGVEMVLVPEGEFQMGYDKGDLDERPVHPIYLDSYYIDKFEVTNAHYSICVDAGVCKEPQSTESFSQSFYYRNPRFDQYPVVYVDWNMANTYCEWRGAKLPTEAQWEKAARATDERIYPWGEEIDCPQASYKGCTYDTSKVGSYEAGKSPYGAYDMSGNVWEWVADWYSENYYASSPLSNPSGPDAGRSKVTRGGSWVQDAYRVRATNRVPYAPTYANLDIGFRCARPVNNSAFQNETPVGTQSSDQVVALLSADPSSGKAPLRVSFSANLRLPDGSLACNPAANCTFYWSSSWVPQSSRHSMSFSYTFRGNYVYEARVTVCYKGVCDYETLTIIPK